MEAMLGLTLYLCGGIIGRDLTSGSLALMLSRPLRRRDYVLTKWLAISTLTSAIALVQLGVQVSALLLRHHPVDAGQALANAADRVIFSFVFPSVLVLFSAIARGSWNAGLWLIGVIVINILGLLPVHWLQAVIQRVEPFFLPHVNLWKTFHSTPISYYSLSLLAATMLLSLGLAVWRMNVRELSYGT
jgi:ABC-type transport system involved in multi-copper enzyme maturation permease subunit